MWQKRKKKKSKIYIKNSGDSARTIALVVNMNLQKAWSNVVSHTR